jgi:3-methyladenine DNA glycosylase AlkD
VKPGSKRVQTILADLRLQENEESKRGMSRYGINVENAYGVSIPRLRSLAKQVGKDHDLAIELWESGIHEARILASLVDDPSKVSEKQMDSWTSQFDSWDVCDLCCSNLFDKTSFAYSKAIQYAAKEGEFVKRAGFVLMACLAVHDKKASDKTFLTFLPIIRKESIDDRNFVRKSVNWALRQVGKRNARLNEAAIKAAKEISKIDSKSSRWIASDALRELTSKQIKKKLAA